MRVHLKFSAFTNGRLFPQGVVEDWPDDVKLPATARKLDADEVVEELATPEEPEPDTLSELQKRSTGKK